MKLQTELCPEATSLQELGNELIARPNYDEAVLGHWRHGPMLGFGDMAERPTTVLTTSYPWLPEGDTERLAEVNGLEYPIFSIASAAIFGTQTPTIVRIALGGTMNQSLFDDRGRCTVSVSTQQPNKMWSTSERSQDGINADAGFGYGPVDVLGIIVQIRQAAQ